jgi:hypothetical protein
MVLGFSNRLAGGTALPLSLAAIGMPSCNAHVSADATTLIVGSSGTATFRLPIPNALPLLGVHFYNQAFVPDPGAGNVLGAVVSDAAAAVVGR